MAFHGLSSHLDVTGKIGSQGFKVHGPRQEYKDIPDIRTKKHCGPGCYCTPHIEVADKYYSEPISITMKNGPKKYNVAMQCRVNPNNIRIPSKNSDIMPHRDDKDWINDYWIINSSNDIRPYRILFKEV